MTPSNGALGLQGTLRGYDQATNLILDKCHERVYSAKVTYSLVNSQQLPVTFSFATDADTLRLSTFAALLRQQ